MSREIWIDLVSELVIVFVRAGFAWFLYNYYLASFLDLPSLEYWEILAIVIFVGILTRK